MPPEVAVRVCRALLPDQGSRKGTASPADDYGFSSHPGTREDLLGGRPGTCRPYVRSRPAERAILVPGLDGGPTRATPRGRESILLFEDDKLVRTHTENQLIELGYRVTSATSPVEAMKIARLIGKPDLLLTDIVMPGGENGCALAARMRERWPDLKVLCTSGYADRAIEGLADGLADGFHFLGKPFRRKDLALKVREVLDTPVPLREAV